MAKRVFEISCEKREIHTCSSRPFEKRTVREVMDECATCIFARVREVPAEPEAAAAGRPVVQDAAEVEGGTGQSDPSMGRYPWLDRLMEG